MKNLEASDLLLRATKGLRGKPNATIGKGTIYAVVHMGRSKYNHDYENPELTLFVDAVHEWNGADGVPYVHPTALVSIQYQRNRPVKFSEFDKPVGGFMGPASYCYGARVEFKMEASAKAMAGMALITRAQDSISALSRDAPLNRQLSAKRCDLLTLIVALRRIGVSVIVKGAARRRR